MKTNVAYLHDNIVECQQNIVQMEQSGNGPDEDEEASIAKQLNIQVPIQTCECESILSNLKIK